ncbi:MAG TPA: sigma factor-like helix-turn-helix DNA-binding protein [Actinomycetota bacterium]|nr:sigma factor-like helix-turn-helix DNA-binding protein [Actinomycetota bacterium]
MSALRDARSEWVQGHLAEAARIATLLTADPALGPLVAEEALTAALQLVPRRRRDSRLADELLAQLVRRARTAPDPPPADLPEQLAALRVLPRRQRAALVLRHYAELSDERAAVYLDCSPGAVSDLVSRATGALPPEARTDLHDWLDACPVSHSALPPARRSLLRRVITPRVARAAGVAAAVGAGVVAGLQLPNLLREPEPPTRAERLAEIRQVLETREESLPFDPDDPGPGASRMFQIDSGVSSEGHLWSVTGYRDADGNPCLQLVVAYDYGRRRCLPSGGGPIRASLDVDREHGITFISGVVRPGIEELDFVGPGVTWMAVTLGVEDPDSDDPQTGYFGIVLAEELVAVESREAGREGGYDVFPGRLTALDANGKRVARLTMFLARS